MNKLHTDTFLFVDYVNRLDNFILSNHEYDIYEKNKLHMRRTDFVSLNKMTINN